MVLMTAIGITTVIFLSFIGLAAVIKAFLEKH